MSEVMWTRSNGQKVAVTEMNDFHLLNAIQKMKDNGYVSVSDIALFETDPAPDKELFERMMNIKTSVLLNAMDAEARKRGLLR